ncbi:voltage-dependent calcium channel gamma-like subunit [Lampris incognitus]|uniref:voltage-dependent calcium channel gamma-like subunit n=1 Tax=Lampris incognitus TaxID=2546036 RepID=UPI0024B49D4B|nr:voltage-dependent calcium channel gamma-like subunit [Lampris incognitus]
MTAISIKVQGASSPERKSRPHFLEVLVRSLIILCTAMAIVLSSMAVCDGIWLQTTGGRTFGLWHFCTMEAHVAEGTMVVEGALTATGDIVVGQDQEAFSVHGVEVNQQKPDPPDCTTHLRQSGVTGVETGLGLCRFLVCSAVVAAIFGLELQVISQVSKGRDAACRWYLGSALVLVAAVMSALSVVVFVVLLQGSVSPTGFTLNFWCQITTVFLFSLNGIAARHIHSMAVQAPPSGTLGKC